MGKSRYADAIRQVDVIFGTGSVVGLTDGQLLERFTDRAGAGEASEAAFVALLARHGPMVLRVCRAILRDPEEAEDAFQSVFLVLVLRAGSIRNRDSLASWLHGVAARVASRSRASAARRRKHESQAGDRVEPGVGWDDAGPAIHRELGQIPEKYAAPIVLCHLEGLTHEEAALRLDWPVGTVRSRLARGRDRLRSRLIRRGLSPSVVALSARPFAGPAPALSPALLDQTVRIAIRMASGRTLISAVASASTATLTTGVLKTMTLIRWKLAASIALGLGMLGAGVAVVAQSNEPRQEPAQSKPQAATPAKPRGTVTDQAIRRQLGKKLAFDLPDNATLEDLLKYIKANTRDEAQGLPNGIPIYVDPRALQEAKLTMGMPLESLDRGGALGWALSQTLREHHLAFDVQDGLMTILSPMAVMERRLERVEDKLDRVLKALEESKPAAGK